MSRQKDYISIAEFAKIAGITPTAVYNRINKQVHELNDNQFMNHIKIVDGKKRINIAALEFFNTNKSEPVDEQVHELIDNQLLTLLKENMDVLKRELEVKTKQLENRDNQVLSLQDQLNKQFEQINKANDRLNDRLQEANQLNHQNQILLDQKQQPQPIEAPPEPKKKSFWSRLFRKEG